MQIIYSNRSADDKSAIDVMRHNEQYQNDPLVGIFWYDVNSDELFGVKSTFADEARWYTSPQWHSVVRTEARLHKQVWDKEHHKGRDRRFNGDHTLVPRGRVFEFKDHGFRVYTGSWINDYPQVKDMILDEFQLPKDTEFVLDSHWDIGHGWSDEF